MRISNPAGGMQTSVLINGIRNTPPAPGGRFSCCCKGRRSTFARRSPASPRRKTGGMSGGCVSRWPRPSNHAAPDKRLPAGEQERIIGNSVTAEARRCFWGLWRTLSRRQTPLDVHPPPSASRKDLYRKLDSSGYSSPSSTQILKQTIPGCQTHKYFISIKKKKKNRFLFRRQLSDVCYNFGTSAKLISLLFVINK